MQRNALTFHGMPILDFVMKHDVINWLSAPIYYRCVDSELGYSFNVTFCAVLKNRITCKLHCLYLFYAIISVRIY